MKMACVLNAHNDPDVIIDTIQSIYEYGTDKVLLVIDGANWSKLKSINFGVPKVKGFCHNIPRSPYRNVALSLKLLTERWPEVKWYCYTEYDTLFTSNRFKHNLEIADKKNVWMLGNDGRLDDNRIPLVECMLKEEFKSYYYLLGCCQFFHADFMKKLNEINFFDRFLNLTNHFSEGYMPGYNGHDVSETMYPTLCRHFGGNVGVFATWGDTKKWHGSYRVFPMRWQPEIDPQTENFSEASIIHPLKTLDHPVRVHHRKKRKVKCSTPKSSV